MKIPKINVWFIMSLLLFVAVVINWGTIQGQNEYIEQQDQLIKHLSFSLNECESARDTVYTASIYIGAITNFEVNKLFPDSAIKWVRFRYVTGADTTIYHN